MVLVVVVLVFLFCLSLFPTPRPPSHSFTLPLLRHTVIGLEVLFRLTSSHRPPSLLLPAILLDSIYFQGLFASRNSPSPSPSAWCDDRKDNWGVGDLALIPTSTVRKLLSFSMPQSPYLLKGYSPSSSRSSASL